MTNTTVHAFNHNPQMASSAAACGAQGWRGPSDTVNCPDCKAVTQEAEIVFPTPICPDAEVGTPHAKHRIEGTWREECPGVEATAEQTQGEKDWPTAYDGQGNAIVPGARKLAPECGAELRTFPFGYCNRPAGHPTDSLNHDRRFERPARNRVTDPDTRTDADALRDTANHHQGTRVHAADADHGRQLRRAGLTGKRGGLTRRGSIVAESLRNQALDDAFGPL